MYIERNKLHVVVSNIKKNSYFQELQAVVLIWFSCKLDDVQDCELYAEPFCNTVIFMTVCVTSSFRNFINDT